MDCFEGKHFYGRDEVMVAAVYFEGIFLYAKEEPVVVPVVGGPVRGGAICV